MTEKNGIFRVAALLVMFAMTAAASLRGEEPISFNRDIRPILQEFCVDCHGPAERNRLSDLRLDTREGAFAQLESVGSVIVPGDSQHSPLYQRISATDPDQRMPPADAGKALTREQIQRVAKWIDQGASWETHWAYVAPHRPLLPHVKNKAWPRNPIDYFTLAELEKHSLVPSGPAEKVRLPRRVTLDLTGLPPTGQEVDAFLADTSPGAYERLVDRLLGSPRYGERMAVIWLDLARYADTHGYHIDSHRDMWRWREWVIDALNHNMPYDRFTIEQLAGDLLPAATLEQRIATGFNRNHMVNFEAGAIPEEYLAEYVADRVMTTCTVWLGQTIVCARCHDHKYDPFTRRDFYRLSAFFQNVAEKGLDGEKGNAAPYIEAPTDSQRWQLDQLDQRILAIEAAAADRARAIGSQQSQWEKSMLAGIQDHPDPPADMLLHLTLDETRNGGPVIDAVSHQNAGTLSGEAIWVPGKFGEALLFDGSTCVELGQLASFDRSDPFSISAWFFATSKDSMAALAKMEEGEESRGLELYLSEGTICLNLIHRGEKDALRVRTKQPLELRKWQHVAVIYDGSSRAAGVRVYRDGHPLETEVAQDNLTQTIKTEVPLRLGRGTNGPYRGMIDDVRLYPRELSASEVSYLAGSDPIREILLTQADRRTDEQRETLRSYFLENYDEPYRKLQAQLQEARRRRTNVQRSVPTTMVMQEMERPRETFVLEHGDYQRKGERVAPGVPEFLLPFPANAPRNRLGLARWLVDPAQPLTARLAVNRAWQTFFGTGIVRTAEDFGSRGQPPSHPELLDWLATELIDSGWDMKHIHRLIVTSATYRQSSRVMAAMWQRDPENRLLARGPHQRLPAETIRDSALFVAGLLDERMGGPSVYPYQPEGLWEEISYNPRDYTAQIFVQSHGADLYRRSVYTFWKRSVPPPPLATFDAPNREVCTARRSTTNTPLQALVLMNDPTYVEASRAFAERILTEAEAGTAQRIDWAFRRLLARPPSPREVEILADMYAEQLAEYQRDRGAAKSLLKVGESKGDGLLEPCELAAWTTVASVLFNVDEMIVPR